MLKQRASDAEIFPYDEDENLAQSCPSALHHPSSTPGARNMPWVPVCTDVDDYDTAKDIDWSNSQVNADQCNSSRIKFLNSLTVLLIIGLND